jgi:hypothetical protein
MPGGASKRRKVVQTELDPEEYEALQSLVKGKNISIKEAAREALRLWTASESDLAKDPLFKLKPVEFKVKVKSPEIDSFLYGKKK